eukprot:jgi/Botrbrau1/3638/Bobra.0204s0029.1
MALRGFSRFVLAIAVASSLLVKRGSAEEITVQLLPPDVSSLSTENGGNVASSGYVNLNYASTQLTYEVHVSNLEGARSVQLRLGDSDQGGIVVANLYKAAFEPTSNNLSNGLLAQGTLNDYDLVGPMELPKGRYVTVSQFYEWYVRSGSTFFQINTVNRPQGELKGQINPNARRRSPPSPQNLSDSVEGR